MRREDLVFGARRRLACVICWAICCLAPPSRIGGQPSPRIPLSDPVYEQLDRLAGSGLVRTIIYGQRPYRASEIQRILVEATVLARTRQLSASTTRVLANLVARFQTNQQDVGQRILTASTRTAQVGDTARLPGERFASVELLAHDSPSRGVPPAPVGGLDADLNPLLNARAGRRFARGPTFAAELGISRAFGRHALVTAQPRVAAGATSTERFAELSLQQASVAVSARNLMFEIGRQPIVWGPAMEGGLMLSSSGRPLDMIQLSTMRPWRAPWVFRWLGFLRGSAFLADLGPRQNFPHAKVAAYKLSGQITSYFEFSAGVLVHGGGRGAPPASLVDRFVDLVPALKYSLPDNTTQFSNKLAGWDTRVRVPWLHGVQLYTESVFDDMDPRRWRSTLWEDGGHIAGAALSQIGPGGAITATTEFHHTGLRYYQHTPFTSGITFNRTLLGDPLGPQGDGAYFRVRHDAGGSQRWRIDAAVERRGGDIWSTASDSPRDASFRFVLDRHQPAEWRHRVSGEWSLARTTTQQLVLSAGVERVRDAGFVRDVQRTNGLVGMQWSWLTW